MSAEQDYREGAVIASCLLIGGGGVAGIHERGFLIERYCLLVCCGHSIFCLILPELSFVWRPTADMATCFEIYKFKHVFIIHGELEITRIDHIGNIVWKFVGDEIFTTPSGKNDFKIVDDVIFATNWDGRIFQLNASTVILIN